MNVLCYRLLFGTLLVISTIMPAHPLAAEEENQQLRNLLEELKSEIERAEQQRLADPWFLRDLRDLVSNYENPWRNEILYDNFSSRERKPSEPWQISAGEFLVDWRHGLRSVVETPRQETQTQRKGDEMEQLFGALLNEALGTGENSQESATDPDYAAILAPVPISNAFSITINLNSRAMEHTGGAFEWGPFQGQNAARGYRLVYTPDPAAGLPPLALRKVTSRGASTLEIHDQLIDIQDGQDHSFSWTRDANGQMIVRVDNEQVIRVVDRSFQQSFDGFAMINQGGDYAVQEVSIMGTDSPGTD